MQPLHIKRWWEIEIHFSQVNAWSAFRNRRTDHLILRQHEPRLQLLTEQQSDCEAFFSEPPWGPGFSSSKEMNHKKQWWAVKTSVCKAQGGVNTTGIWGWMRRGENLLQCRQLCGNPSMVTVFGHSLWDRAKDLGQGKMSTWQRRKDWKKRLGYVNYLYCSGWVHTVHIWGLTKHMPALLNSWDLVSW